MKALTELTCSRSLGVQTFTNLDAVASQPLTPSAPNTNVSPPLSFCPAAVGTTLIGYSSPASATAIERNENEVEKKDGGHSYVIYARDLSSVCSHNIWHCRKGVHEIVCVDAALAMAQRATEKSTPPTEPVDQDKKSPAIPPRIVGSKRKFVEDQSTYSNSINPARKKCELPWVLCFTVMH